MVRRFVFLILVLLLAGAAAFAVVVGLQERQEVRREVRRESTRPLEYVGSAVCASCHPEQTAAWTGSCSRG